MIKAVLFDVDGVLLDSFESNFAFFKDLFTLAGYPPITRERYSRMMHLSMYEVIKTWIRSNSAEEIQHVFYLGMNPDFGIRHPELMTVPKSSPETIELLSKSYRLGIVTSRIRNGIYRVPQLAKLEKYFQVTIAYEDTAKHKPNADPLLLAAEKLQIDQKEIVYIGDTEADLTAGHAAGMRVIIYGSERFEEADGVTKDFSELPELIENIK